MNYRTFGLEDWIAHINEAIEDERGLDGNEMRDLVAFLSEMPRWIPVSEGLPKENTAVLIWCPERKNTYCAYLEEGQWWIFGAHFQKVTLEVIAWMPLPKPYKAERDDESCDEIWEKAYKEREGKK